MSSICYHVFNYDLFYVLIQVVHLETRHYILCNDDAELTKILHGRVGGVAI